ncbi:MFS transporter [Naumannella cuiyingiana]|uniref:Putative proline/betaine transporter n=1 Tax=Naumannella cuiyingiana TaxID=1347891 RepID=A0A7Z0IKL0_9ACTN|nr:MFS transporter [Naumannella cuiyingiana]NYI70729.1 metabolite-proton symporter [Naumannella cuiyingiana]
MAQHNEVRDPAMTRRVITASFVGTAIEWYDFYLYGTASALVFNVLFFPSFDPLVGTLVSFGTFAAGFLARPIGGIVFGHFGDRIGRKSMLVWSLVGMGAATFLIGLLPTYAQIGVAAPLLLLLLRLLQGFAVGGEWGGAVLMSVESTDEKHRGLAGSWTQAGSPAGLVLSTVVFGLTTLLPPEDFLAWGWRIPFLFSALLVGVGLFIRLRVIESPEFERVEASGERAAMPALEALRQHPLNIVLAAVMCLAPFVNFYMFATFILTYATTTLGMARGTVLTIVAVAGFAELFTIPLCAALSDRIGRRRVFLTGTVLFALYAYPFFLINQAFPSVATFAITTFVGLALIHPFMYGPMATLFAELFPARVRYSGASLGYQIGAIFGGGFAPLILTALLATGLGAVVTIPPYMILVSVLTFIAVWVATQPGRRWMGEQPPQTTEGEPRA